MKKLLALISTLALAIGLRAAVPDMYFMQYSNLTMYAKKLVNPEIAGGTVTADLFINTNQFLIFRQGSSVSIPTNGYFAITLNDNTTFPTIADFHFDAPTPNTVLVRSNLNTLILTNGGPGNGSGLTNLSWPGVTTIKTNATSTDFQAAFNSGGVIWITPGTYSVTNLFLTKSVRIIGNNAVLKPLPGVTGFLVDTLTNVVGGPVVIEDLVFDGGYYTNFFNSAMVTTLNGFVDPYYNANWQNYSGLRYSTASGGALTRCIFRGWRGQGFMLVNVYDSFAMTSQRAQTVGNTCYSNFIGGFVLGASYHYGGYTYSGSSVLASAEYQTLTGNRFFYNTFGLCDPSGNAQIIGNSMTKNAIGFWAGSCQNAAHGIYANNCMNHNNIGSWVESNNGGLYRGNTYLGSYAAHCIFNLVTEAQIEGNWFGGNFPLIITNTCTGTSFRNNYYQGRWGVDMATNFSPTVFIGGNRSTTVAGDTDGTSLSLVEMSNGSGLTNLNLTQPLDGSGISNISAGAFRQVLLTTNNDGTLSNYVANVGAGTGIRKAITFQTLGNQFNVQQITGIGSIQYIIQAGGTNRVISCPSNWVCLASSQAYMSKAGTNWMTVLGSNQVGYLTIISNLINTTVAYAPGTY